METQGKEKYDYWIEHISQDMDYDDQANNNFEYWNLFLCVGFQKLNTFRLENP